MYLTKIILNLKNRYVIQNMSNCEWVHKILLEKGFGDIQEKEPRKQLMILYNMNENVIIMQSAVAPRFHDDSTFEGIPKTIDISRMKELFVPGNKLHFKCTCNPTKKTADGKRRFLTSAEDRSKWIRKVMNQAGAELLFHDESPEITVWGKKKDKKTNQIHKIYAKAVTYTGTIRILDGEKFGEVFCKGIGREKAYGCGMIMIFR